jgi:hypothetical protein
VPNISRLPRNNQSILNTSIVKSIEYSFHISLTTKLKVKYESTEIPKKIHQKKVCTRRAVSDSLAVDLRLIHRRKVFPPRFRILNLPAHEAANKPVELHYELRINHSLEALCNFYVNEHSWATRRSHFDSGVENFFLVNSLLVNLRLIVCLMHIVVI